MAIEDNSGAVLPEGVAEGLGFSEADRFTEIASRGYDPQTALGRTAPVVGLLANGLLGGILGTLAPTAQMTLERIVQHELARAPDFIDVALGDEAAGLVVRRWSRNPSIVVIESDLAIMRCTQPAATPSDGVVVVDVRHEPAYVRVALARGPGVLRIDARNITLLLLVTAPSPELERVAAWMPPAPLTIESPPLRDILAGVEVDEWLIEAADALATSPSPLDRTAAAGLVARLWSPTHAADRFDELLEGLLTDSGPRMRARTWFATLGAGAHRCVARAALDEAIALRSNIAVLEEAIARGEPDAAARALACVRRRDDLESVAALFEKGEDAALVVPALADLDAAAATHHSMWSLLDPIDDPRLAAVAWQEPYAWWGRLASGT